MGKRKNKHPKRAIRPCKYVILCKQGGKQTLWAFDYVALARLLGKTKSAVRQMVYAGKLNPVDLEAVCKMWQAARAKKKELSENPPEDDNCPSGAPLS